MKISFRGYWVITDVTCCHQFSAESASVWTPSWPTDINAMFFLSMDHYSHLLAHIKFSLIFWVISTALVSTTGLPLQTCSFEHVTTIQTFHFPYHHVLLHESPFNLKYHPLAKPAVQENHNSLNTVTEWRVGFRMPGQPYFCHFLSTCLAAPSFLTAVLPGFLLFTCTFPLHAIKNSKYNMWQTLQHIPMYKRSASLALTSTAASSTQLWLSTSEAVLVLNRKPTQG